MPPKNVPVKYCRFCGRLIQLDTADCPYCGANTIRLREDNICPFCKEAIKPGAVKCRHCHEFLDGRNRPITPPAETIPDDAPQQVVIQIEKAIIAGSPDGVPTMVRPDGQSIALDAVPRRALDPGVVAALPPPEHRALPGDVENLPAIVDATAVVSRPATEEVALPTRPKTKEPKLPARRKSRKPRRQPEVTPDGTPPMPATPVPPVQYECPSCKRWVLEGDNYCENCGRDLSLHPDQREFAEPVLSTVAEFSLGFGLLAPAGFLLETLLGRPWSLSFGVLGLVLGVWAVPRILGSHRRLRGVPHALAGIVLSAFWLLILGITA